MYIGSEQIDPLADGLRHQEALKGIAMMMRQLLDHHSMLVYDGEPLEALPIDPDSKLLRIHPQLAESGLDSRFPH